VSPPLANFGGIAHVSPLAVSRQATITAVRTGARIVFNRSIRGECNKRTLLTDAPRISWSATARPSCVSRASDTVLIPR